MPILTHVVSLRVDKEEERVRAKRLVEGDVEEIETVETDLPAFVVADPEFEPTYRRAEHRLTVKDLREETGERAESYDDHLTVWDHEELNLDPDFVGLDGSPTIVESVDPIPKAPAEREATMVDPDDREEMDAVLDTMRPLAGGD